MALDPEALRASSDKPGTEEILKIRNTVSELLKSCEKELSNRSYHESTRLRAKIYLVDLLNWFAGQLDRQPQFPRDKNVPVICRLILAQHKPPLVLQKIQNKDEFELFWAIPDGESSSEKVGDSGRKLARRSSESRSEGISLKARMVGGFQDSQHDAPARQTSPLTESATNIVITESLDWEQIYGSTLSYCVLGPVPPEKIRVTIRQGDETNEMRKCSQFNALKLRHLQPIVLRTPGDISEIYKNYPHLKVKDCEEWLADDQIRLLPAHDYDIVPEGPHRLRVFDLLRSTFDGEGVSVLDRGRLRALQDCLLTHFPTPEKSGNAFDSNGYPLAVSLLDLQSLRTGSLDGRTTLLMVLQLTSYYSYRILAASAKVVVDQLRKECDFCEGPHLSDYLGVNFQELVHLSTSALIVLHTIEDDKLIFRRRSQHCHDSGERDKRYCAACEGVYENNVVQLPDAKLTLDYNKILEEALRREVFGDHVRGKPVKDLIEAASLIGAFVWTQNLSIPLVFLVSVRCTEQEVMAADAEHAMEFRRRRRWADPKAETIPNPEFTPAAVKDFIRRTTAASGKAITDEWCEGPLLAAKLAIDAREKHLHMLKEKRTN
jgi:hypothetical protein